ncbi:uronate isomerase [Phycisphaera mikurensis NBRC 102666]|uniref:Uronate isomerase n=2 Tax=Phycisphaera TaxID=666508 RepID=I0IDB8_PHYMF|nr:uronate isomerase [Phycisphaera mikurensis NBRC 102666]
MPAYLHDDFLLSCAAARRLYHEAASGEPICDYHCHLPPADLASRRTFEDLHAAWLGGDHYKWRAMRALGVEERLITGDADPRAKFQAFAESVPRLIGNPLHHWTHLELRRCFGIDTMLDGGSAQEVWDEANRILAATPAPALLRRFDVRLVGTTDFAADPLDHHAALASDPIEGLRVVPTFRPDACHQLGDTAAWNRAMDALGAAAGVEIDSLATLVDALKRRHAFFGELGCRASDHGLLALPDAAPSESAAARVFDRLRGHDEAAAGPDGQASFSAYLMHLFGKLDHDDGRVHQLHLGAARNLNAAGFDALGPDTGFDAIGDARQGPGLVRHLSALAAAGRLPRTVLYNLNPVDNHLFATVAGSFQGRPAGGGSTAPGHVQFGSGWWFLDQDRGMRDQIQTLMEVGVLSTFIGMLTDSRSFLSFPRHEYFRRILCDEIGRRVDAGLIPDDADLLDGIVRGICFGNAMAFLGVQSERGSQAGK